MNQKSAQSVSPSTTANEQRESGYMFDDETHGLAQNNSYDFPTNDFHHGLSESSQLILIFQILVNQMLMMKEKEQRLRQTIEEL